MTGLITTGSSVRLEKDVTGDMGSDSGSGSGDRGLFLVLTTFLVFTTVVVALFVLAGAVLFWFVVVFKKKVEATNGRDTREQKGQRSGGFDKEKREKTG